MTDENLKKAEKDIFGKICLLVGSNIPTEKEFLDAAGKSRQAFDLTAPVLGLESLTDKEYKKILDSIRVYFTVKMAGTDALIQSSEEHKPWLNQIKGKKRWFFWNRYSRYLEEDKHWTPILTASLDKTSDKILNLLGNPNSKNSFSRRGLIIGDVQSGKTANYTAICCKAADAGYDVIIVLTGMLEDLRRQTQERLDLEFAGRKSQVFLSNANDSVKNNEPIGVGKYGNQKLIPQFTSTSRDFSRNILLAQNLDIRSFKGTILFVVKKNKNILENLIDWLKNSITNGKTQIDRSLLLIDDEADNASINTNQEEEDPTAINRCIREILNKFYQTTYVGITATPFANIFINPDSAENMLGDDLFPKDFIYALDVPENYIGPSAIFGDNGKFSSMLVKIEPEDNPDVEEVFPKKHKSSLKVDKLPQSLYEAMNYFLLVNAVRDLQGDKNTHRTMLIHVSRFVSVQKQIYDLVNAWNYRVTSDLRNYSALPADEAERNSRYIAELHKVFDKYDLKNVCKLDWKDFLHHLREAVEPVTVGLRNSSGKDSFSYADNPDGLRVIAVGGNSFSRGLTLEGLCVTYFYRHSKTYDTLMQMGRWFGYRPRYDSLCKIWMSSEIMDWYGYITDVSNELREEISFMQQLNMTPKDFGLKVRQHPGALMITAQNKMRSGVPIKRPVGLDKIFLETPRLINDSKILDENKKLILEFVSSLAGFPPAANAKNKNSWSGVPKEKISDLIFRFKTAPWHLAFQSQPIGEYIRSKMGDEPWDVIIPEGESKKIYSELRAGGVPIEIKPIQRKILASDEQIMISGTKVRVGSLGVTKAGLTNEQIQKIESEYRSVKGNEDKKNLPDRAYMVYGRNPLLVLYVIEPKDKSANIPDVLFALGVGFPARSKDSNVSRVETADYLANVTASADFNFSIFDDDEDIEE